MSDIEKASVSNEKLIYLLAGDDPVELEEILGRCPEQRERADALRTAYAELVAKLPSARPSETQPSNSISHYDLLDVIAQTDMSIVYRARHKLTGRLVALKAVRAAERTPERARAIREVQLHARIKSDHVVMVYECGETEELVYAAMELLEGTTFAAFVESQRGVLPEGHDRKAANMVIQACAGVAAIHEHEVVHRDLKPSNLFFTAKGVVKVLDLGIARRPDSSRVTLTGATIGTLAYMSPEQVRGEPASLLPTTDVYSLGATLYELVTLRCPFTEEQIEKRRQGDPGADPPPARTIDSSVPPDLSAVIGKAMEFDPTRRYATVAALEAELQAFLEGLPVSAAPVGRIGRWRRWAERRKWKIAGTSLIALTLALITGALWFTAARFSRRSAAEAALADARQSAQEYKETLGSLPSLEAQLLEKRRTTPDSAEYASRQVIFQITTALQTRRSAAEEKFETARLAAERGLQVDRDHVELRDFLVDLLWGRYLASETAGREEETLRLRTQLWTLAPERRDTLVPLGTASIVSRPAGAAVRLYRYRAVGPLLQPVPFRPGAGELCPLEKLPPPTLRVVRPPDPLLAGFGIEQGDRVLKVQGKPVDVSGPRVLAKLDKGGEWLELEIERRGKVEEWRVPTRSGGKSILQALAACLEGDAFPLAMLPDGACSTTPTAPLKLEAGSYLAVLRLAGYRDTRLPFVVSRDVKLDLKLILYTDAEIGPDFVYVPAGITPVAGDPQAHYAEPERMAQLEDYFIGKYEVTYREYFEFLNDPVVNNGIAEWVTREKDTLLPFNSDRGSSSPLFEHRADGTFVLKSGMDINSPVRWISRAAAERFVRWRTELEERRGGSLTFTLPRADELEKAARGLDRRQFPWGDTLDWSLLLSYRTRSSSRHLKFPTDASPYDARDLAGSLSEFTSTDESPPEGGSATGTIYPECRIKGGSLFEDLESEFRVGGHHRERITEAFDRTGFRLVAYPPSR